MEKLRSPELNEVTRNRGYRIQETELDGKDEAGQEDCETNLVDNEEGGKKSGDVKIETATGLLYGVADVPPLTVSLPFALQISAQTLSLAITNSILISQALCAPDLVLARIMNTSVFLAGLTTLLQTTIGIRLPLYQGPAIIYLLPIVARATLPDWQCPSNLQGNGTGSLNSTGILADTQGYVSWDIRLSQVSGSLMVVSLIHAVLGYTGLVGYLIPYIGPLTISPALFLLAIDIVVVLRGFSEISWIISSTTLVVVVTCTCYLAGVLVPLPSWNRKNGWRVTRRQIFRPFGIIFGIIFGWILSYALTEAGVFSDNPDDLEYKARTDNKGDVIEMSSWVYVPYPGQFGLPSFNIGIFFSLIIAMITSVLDSVADYMIASRVCRIGRPPPHAVNRGLFLEGVCSILSGIFGAGHATTTYSGIIGNVSLTGIASRRVFQFVGIMLMVIGIFGKLSAFLVSIPKPVVGGFGTVAIASFLGMALSGIEEVDMSRPRNVISLGLPVVLGTMLPGWVRAKPTGINTGVKELDEVLRALLSNSMFVGGIVGFILDNTLPGKQKKRDGEPAEGERDCVESSDVSSYELPYIGRYLRRQKWTRFVPIFPHRK